MRRVVLYQWTQAAVAFSTSLTELSGPVRNGDPGRMHSVLFQPDCGLREGIVIGVTDRPDGGHHSFEEHGFGVVHSGVFRPGMRVRHGVGLHWVALPAPVVPGVA